MIGRIGKACAPDLEDLAPSLRSHLVLPAD
jgi:hypothetical protein